MKFRRFLTLVLILSLVGGATVFADDIYDTYKGKRIKVLINDTDTGSGGIVLDAKNGGGKKVVMSLNDMASSLQALVQYDQENQTVNIYKPNVHMMVIDSKKYQIIGDVSRGDKYSLYILNWIDSLKTDVSSLKMTLEDPYGEVVYSEEKALTKQSESFWWGTTPTVVDFKYSGKYVVRLYMKQDGSVKYTPVSERVLNSRSDQ